MEKKANAVNEALQFPLAEAFEADLNQALTEAEDVGAVVIAMVDADHFMQVNDQFGHAAGDKVLIEIGRHFEKTLPEGARIYRYSGDCFAILLNSGMEKEDFFLAMEAARQSFSVKSPDGQPVTVSIGVAAAPEDGTRYAELVRKAEGAMYRGKLGGRNRVTLAREEKMVTKTSHYTVEQLKRLTKLSGREGIGEAILLREALDQLLKKYDV